MPRNSASGMSDEDGRYVRADYDGGKANDAPIVVNMPVQRASRAPWVVLFILLALILALLTITVASCSVASGLFGTSSANGFTRTDSVAVIHVSGSIAGSGSGAVTPETFKSELDAAEADQNVKAIVVRVNSGGGSAGSSEEMATYVADCSKPVVVSVSDSCASGAYYMASQADWVVADGGASIGSIGVIMSKYDITDFLQSLGISVDYITSGSDKDVSYYASELTDDQRAKLQAQVDSINSHFIDAVAVGRGLDRDVVATLATGQTWSGYQALDLGLVDQVGTYDDALSKAADFGGMDDYEVVSFDEETSSSTDLLTLISGLL